MKNRRVVGVITASVAKTIGMSHLSGRSIYIGESNINHMKQKHWADYQKYKDKIPLVLSHPDWVGINPEDGSIEYIKTFSDHVKIAIRIAGDGEFYARSLYGILDRQQKHLFDIGRIKPLTKSEK